MTVHKKHTSALEKALRCLDNDAINSEEIDPLRDDLEYYMVSGHISHPVCACYDCTIADTTDRVVRSPSCVYRSACDFVTGAAAYCDL